MAVAPHKTASPTSQPGDTIVPRWPVMRLVGQVFPAAGNPDRGVTKISATSVGSLTN